MSGVRVPSRARNEHSPKFNISYIVLLYSVLSMKILIGSFNQEEAFSVTVKSSRTFVTSSSPQCPMSNVQLIVLHN